MRNFILLLLLSGLFIVTGCGGNTQYSLQPEAVTQKYFPNPDIQINTPAFQKKQGFTNYAEMTDFLKKIIATHKDVVKMAFIGKTVSGKPIPILYIGKGDTTKKVRIWLQGGLHGNEPAGTEGLLYFIQQLLQNKNADSVFNRISLA
ncbi:MAG TPA: M14 family zinc carboxypeptidase, partial [Bacteroidales bacterium]|nr:M14 family zinc carboxypeptidase [Bacteroidales bacterium]